MTEYSLRGRFNKALVTGGAGFVGSHIVESLLDDGLKVVALDDFSAGTPNNLSAFEGRAGFAVAECDITDRDALEPFLSGVDIVFHEAVSKMTVCLKDPARDLEVNAQGTFNVLDAANRNGVRKFVHASTGSVYGDALYYPTDEKHPLNPNSYYGVSKLAAEKYVRAFSHLYGLDVVILRYYHVYGPKQDHSNVGGVTSIFGWRAIRDEPLIIFGDGTQLRSFTYVKDVVRINKLVALTDGISGEAYNCASGARITIGELADAVLRQLGKEHLDIEYRDWKLGDIKVFDVDNSKLKALGFEFLTGFEDGLADILAWLAGQLER